MDPIAKFAEHAATTAYDALPPAAIAAAKVFLLDSIGVGVAGSSGPWIEQLVACLGQWGTGSDSRLLVRGTVLPAPAAAMGNAYQIHNSEFDCVHEAAVVHPMAALLAAGLAHAERAGGVGGRELLTAVILGVDVACHIGVASNAPLKFFRPGTAGAFGATATVGRMMGFDTATMVNAMGLAYSQMCGTMQAHTEGSLVLAMQIGFNARNALVACDMAARGLVAPQNLLEGPFGYYNLFEGAHDLAPVLAALGKVWRIAEVAHKPYPSGRATHGVVDGVLELQRELGFAADAVELVTARLPPLTHRLVARPIKDDPSPNYARLCVAYVAARALIGRTVGVDDFRPEKLNDPETHALARRFEIHQDDNPDGNALLPVTVAVALKDGTRHERTLDVAYGNPAKPMTRAAYLDKFRRNWVSGASPLDEAAGERLVAAIDDIEAVAEVGELIDLAVR